MSEEAPQSGGEGETANLLLIVVGSHLRAEMADRPLAYRLRERMRAWLEKHAVSLNLPVIPVVCCDLWYLNEESMHHRPTVSLGGPGVNALSDYFHQNLPRAVVNQNQMVLQLDPEFIDLRVSIWGMNHDRTVDALEYFTRKHMDGYLRAVATQVEPQDD